MDKVRSGVIGAGTMGLIHRVRQRANGEAWSERRRRIMTASARCGVWSRLAGVILPALLASCSQGPLDRVEFQGWADSYRISNDKAQAIIVPAIGRMMSYRLKDGRNVLDVNESQAGTVPSARDRASYTHFGGLYSWIAPQAHWIAYDGETVVTGADPALDNGPYRVTAMTENALTMVSPVSRAYGLQMIKTYRLCEECGGLEYTVTLRNTGSAPIRWAVWNLAGVRPEGIVFFDVPGGRKDLQFPADPKTSRKRYKGVIEVLPDRVAAVDYRKYRSEGAKIYVRPGSRYVAYRQPGSWFVRRFRADPTQLFTDWQSQIELWANSDVKTGRIFEVEVTSPDFVIPPGQCVSWTEQMSIIEDESPVSANVADEARKLADVLIRAPSPAEAGPATAPAGP